MDIFTIANTAVRLLNAAGEKTVESKLNEKLDATIPYRTTGSLTKFLKPFTIEPYLIVSKEVDFDKKYRDPIIQYCVNVFTSFFLQVFRILTDLKDLKPDIAFRLLQTTPGSESFTICNESLSIEISNYFNNISVGTESNNSNNKDLNIDNHLGSTFSRVLDVKIRSTVNGEGSVKEVSIPIAIRPTIKISAVDEIINAFDHTNVTSSYTYRKNAKSAGTISWWNFITGNDLAKKYKEKRLKDYEADKIMEQYQDLIRKNDTKLIRTGRGFSGNYTMLALTIDELELLSNTYLMDIINSSSERQKWMDMSKTMLVFALDTNIESGMVFISDYKEPYGISIKSISKDLNKEPDFNSSISALLAGRPPIF